MTNYDIYFGAEDRAIDSLSMLLEYPDHPRPEVRDMQKDVREMGAVKWLRAECTKPRWYSTLTFTKRDGRKENYIKIRDSVRAFCKQHDITASEREKLLLDIEKTLGISRIQKGIGGLLT